MAEIKRRELGGTPKSSSLTRPQRAGCAGGSHVVDARGRASPPRRRKSPSSRSTPFVQRVPTRVTRGTNSTASTQRGATSPTPRRRSVNKSSRETSSSAPPLFLKIGPHRHTGCCAARRRAAILHPTQRACAPSRSSPPRARPAIYRASTGRRPSERVFGPSKRWWLLTPHTKNHPNVHNVTRSFEDSLRTIALEVRARG